MAATALVLTAACNRGENEPAADEFTTLEIGLPGDVTRTHLGESVSNSRKVYWSNGDMVALNGVASNALSGIGEEAQNATFTFPGVISAPYSLLYPSSLYEDATHITLPATQSYASGNAVVIPLAGYATDAASISLSHLCAIVQLYL